MLNDFISVIDNFISKDDCQQYIDWLEHYISNGLVFKEDVDYHSKDHFTINCNNDNSFNVLSGDNIGLKFLPSITKPVNDYLKKFSYLNIEGPLKLLKRRQGPVDLPLIAESHL